MRIGDALRETAERLGGGGQIRAFAAWRAAAGPQISAVTRPQRFNAGLLTVACESAVWAQELTYLSGQLLEHMRETDPDCPVRKLRFVPVASS